MHPHQLRYLRVLYRHAAGPLQQLASDRVSAHQLKAMAGVMARLVVNIENETTTLERLRCVAEAVRPDLEALIGDSAELAELAALLDQPLATAPDFETAMARAIFRLGTESGARVDALLQRLVEADWEGWDRIEREQAALTAQSPMPKEAATGSPLFGREAAIAAWLRDQCGEADALEVAGMNVVPGGFSKQTVFLTLRHATMIPEQIVLRLDRPESPLQTSVVAEYPLLKLLHEAGVNAPRPLAIDRDTVTGAPLMAVERLPGRVVADGQRFLEENVPFSCAVSLAQQLAAYHRIPLDRLPAGLPGSGRSIAELMAAELQKFREIWTQSGHQSIVVETAFTWLSSHLHLAGETRSLVHGDLRFHNMLIDDGKVSAILDWELASIGNPASDLGYVYQHIIQLGSWQAFLNAYAQAGGDVPPAATLAFYALRTELFAVVYLTRMAAGFQAGAFEKLDLAYAAFELRQHAIFLLAQRLRATLAGQPL